MVSPIVYKSKIAVNNRIICFNLIFILLFIFLFSNNCSRTEFLYLYSRWVIIKNIKSYFLLTEKQESFLINKIDIAFEWHKQNELPKTVNFLKNFNNLFKDGLTKEELYTIINDYDKLWDALIKKLLPDLTVFLKTINSEQIKALSSKLDKKNEFLEKKIKLTDEELLVKDSDWLITTLDSWVGSLSKEQVTSIRSLVNSDRTFLKNRLKQRRSFQKWFVEEIKKNKTAKELEVSFAPWLLEPESVWSSEFKIQMNKKKLEWTKLILKTDSFLVQKQRNYATKKIEDYILDLNKLALTP